MIHRKCREKIQEFELSFVLETEKVRRKTNRSTYVKLNN